MTLMLEASSHNVGLVPSAPRDPETRSLVPNDPYRATQTRTWSAVCVSFATTGVELSVVDVLNILLA